MRGGLMPAWSRHHHCPAQARGRGLRSDTSPALEAAAWPREAAGAAGSAVVGLERHPDASGQGVRCGARGRAAHRQALCGQGARCGGADGYKLQREERRASVYQPVPAGSRRRLVQGLWDSLSVRTLLLVRELINVTNS